VGHVSGDLINVGDRLFIFLPSTQA